MNKLGSKLTAEDINYKLFFAPGEEDNGISYEENVEWLSQWIDWKSIVHQGRPYFLIECVGCEQPVRIWSTSTNSYQAECTLEWEECDGNDDTEETH